jgi:hypothetical protein
MEASVTRCSAGGLWQTDDQKTVLVRVDPSLGIIAMLRYLGTRGLHLCEHSSGPEGMRFKGAELAASTSDEGIFSPPQLWRVEAGEAT